MWNRVWNWCVTVWETRFRGFRTMFICFALGVLGLADKFQVIELATMIHETTHTSVSVGSIMTVLSCVFLALRLITTTAIGKSYEQ